MAPPARITVEEFHRAKTVLEEGDPLYSLYQIEDARRLLAPVRKGYWRLFLVPIAALLIGLPLGSWLEGTVPASEIWIPTISIPLGAWAMNARIIWRRFIPVDGVRFADIQKAALL
jgi:hypothetical protein